MSISEANKEEIIMGNLIGVRTNLKDCTIVKPRRFGDERGYFESITKKQLEALGFQTFCQLNHSKSSKGTLRGMHFQLAPYTQAKLVTCMSGKVLDVVIDLRSDSPTYKEWTSVLLTPENGKYLFVPRGFAHGFVALEDNTLFEYYVDNIYKPSHESGIIWNDPEININWGLENYGIEKPILSEKDQKRLSLSKTSIHF